jgi:hypothetical protein
MQHEADAADDHALAHLLHLEEVLHKWKCGAMPRQASQRWMKVEMMVIEFGARCTNSMW